MKHTAKTVALLLLCACTSITLASVRPSTHSALEAKLFTTVQLVQKGDVHEAITELNRLIVAYPKYDLPRLIKADLLAKMSDNPTILTQAQQKKLDSVRSELVTRWQAQQQDTKLAIDNKLPAELIFLDAHYAYFIAVDTSKNRMYLFHNSQQHGVRLVQTSYVTIGLNGDGKQKEGDKKTPLGVYFLNGLVTTDRLDPYRYGIADALPIDYPNAMDKSRGRTGHGIWFHGTPKSEEFRPPQASDGCISLSTTEMQALAARLGGHSVPVIITSSMKWLKRTQWQKLRNQFLMLLVDLKYAEERQNEALLARLYRTLPKSQSTAPKNVQFDKIAILFNRHDNLLVTALEWQEGTKKQFKHLYWEQTGLGWQIIKTAVTDIPYTGRVPARIARQ